MNQHNQSASCLLTSCNGIQSKYIPAVEEKGLYVYKQGFFFMLFAAFPVDNESICNNFIAIVHKGNTESIISGFVF